MHGAEDRMCRRRLPPRGRLAAVALTALALLCPGPALAGELFEPVTPAEQALALRSAPQAAAGPAQWRFARLNRSELTAHMAPLDSDQAPDRARRARNLDGRIDMTLRDGVAVALRRSSVDRVDGGGVLWTGDVLGAGSGYSSFLIENGQILGEVRHRGMIYKVEPVAGALHRITEIDARDIPGDVVVPAPPQPESPGPRGESSAGPGPDASAAKKKKKGATRITLLVTYTSKAKSFSSNIVQEIRLAVAWANRAFKDSGAKVKLKLVKTMLTKGYNEDATSYFGNLSDLQRGGAFSKVRRTRNKKKADLVALIREGGEYCGMAFLDEPPTKATANRGFSVTSRGNCLPAVFAHEIGHNMGLRHDRFVEPQANRSQFNYGYVNPGALIRTVMAYNDQCRSFGQFCERIQRFSTPRKTYRGDKIGEARGSANAADSALQLNRNRRAVAAYR